MRSIALLTNPQNLATSEGYTREVEAAARGLGVQVHVLHAGIIAELDAAFRSAKERGADALIIVATYCSSPISRSSPRCRSSMPSPRFFRSGNLPLPAA